MQATDDHLVVLCEVADTDQLGALRACCRDSELNLAALVTVVDD